MKHIDFYFDVISPYAYLAFERLPQALEGISHSVSYKPVLFAGLLKHHGQLGPAEIAPKKLWTFKQVSWLARNAGIDLTAPATHPFNPLALLRLMLALGRGDGTCNRWVAETAFRHVWAAPRSGSLLEASDGGRIAALATQMLAAGERARDAQAVAQLLADESAKRQLRLNTEAAIALGLFGVPSMVVDGQVFWGVDALPMLRAFLLKDPWFDTPDWSSSPPQAGVSRPR